MKSIRQTLGTESLPPPWKFADPKGVISRAGLPDEVSRVIADVVHRTKLRSSERSELARELCAHFADGLEAGTSAQQLIRDFGDPAASAKLIARAVRRKRSWRYHLLRRTAQTIGLTFACLLLTYVWLFVRYNFREPNITRNYLAEFNARVTMLPESKRAWPVYRSLLPDWKHLTERERDQSSGAKPGTPEFDHAIAYARQNAAALAKIREASALPGFGSTLRVDADPVVEEFLTHIEPPSSAFPRPRNGPVSDNPPMILGTLRDLTVVRHLARVMIVDLHAAAADRDAPRATQDVAAVLGMVRQLREQRVLISDLVACAMVDALHSNLQRVLRSQPDLWSEPQLIELAHTLAASPGPGQSFRVRFETERDQFDDVLQRTFSDDGHGDGVMLASAAQLYDDAVMYDPPAPKLAQSTATRLLGPAASVIVAGRRELRTMYNSFIDRTDAVASTPLWQRTDDGMLDAEVELLISRNDYNRLRYMPLSILLPALGSAAPVGEYTQQQHDATIVAVALEIHRRRHGTYPATLDELVPTLLPAIPPDRYTGKPLNYRLRDGKPLLYSVGVDRVDDKGVPPPDKDGNLMARRFRTPAYVKALLANGPPNPDFRGDWILYPDPNP